MVITFSWWWQMKVNRIRNFSKWKNLKRFLNFIKGLCTHRHARTHFFWQVLLSCLHSPSGRVQAMILFFIFCAALLWFGKSKFEQKPCSNDANATHVLPAFCDFPFTPRCMPCARGGCTSRHSCETPGSLLISLLHNKVICCS